MSAGSRDLDLPFDLSVKDVMDLSSDWYWVMDADLRYVYISEGAQTLTEDPPEYLYGKTRQELGVEFDDGNDPVVNRVPMF